MDFVSGPMDKAEKEAEEFITFVNKVAPALMRAFLDVISDYDLSVGGMIINVRKRAS